MSEDELLRAASLRLGRVLRGKYRLERVIGVGGMAAVYTATHRNNKQFAVKMLHAELSSREEVRSRFLREGYVANSVKHPGAVAVLDDDVAEDGSAFLVMELLQGAQVNDLWIEHSRKMPLGLVLSIGDALLGVLTAAHERGIVHRDIKPPNLFITTDGVLKVLDFGIARVMDVAGGASGTITGTLMGTPAFMAPEQALAKASEVDAQTDLWAVGATMFSLLGGELVHTGDNASQLLVNAATKPARSLVSVAKEAPTAVAEVVDKALAFEKASRWATASAMRAALIEACVTATGSPVPALPKPHPQLTVFDETAAPNSPGRWTDAAFAPTVDPSAALVPGAGSTTAGPVAATRTTVAEGKRSRRSRWRGAVGVLLAGAVIAGGAGIYRALHAPHVRACAFLIDTQDGPRCGLLLQPGALERRHARTARITDVMGHVQSIEWIVRGSRPDEDPAREEFVRGASGEVIEVVRRNARGAVLEREKWSRTGGGRRIDLVDIDGTTPKVESHANISTIRREYDSRGRVARETYFGPSDKPRSTMDGAYGFAFEYGRLERWTKMQVLASDGRPGVDARGRATYTRSDDETPLGGDAVALDANDQPMMIDGVVHTKTLFEDTGDVTLRQFFAFLDEPAVNVVSGTHARRETWDPKARVLELTHQDPHDRARAPRGESAATLRITCDERGVPVLEESLDVNGNRTRRRGDGVSATRFERSDTGEELVRDYLDPDGALMLGEGGFARRRSVPDTHGAVVEQRYFDETGQPALWKGGGAIDRIALDDRGLPLRVSHFDKDERPIAGAHGVHETRRKFDRLRNAIEEAYFDVDGRPTVNEDGVSTIRSKYDDDDDLIETAYLDDGGAPVMVHGERASLRFTYDDRGLLASSEALDTHGDRTLRNEGYAVVRYARDRNGDVVSESYFGRHDELVASSDGGARKAMKYDGQRRVIETALLDTHGDPVVGADGWATLRSEYSDKGLVVREDYLDASGSPVVVKDKGASLVKSWDARGNLVTETWLGVDRQPMVATAEGYATRKNEYDAQDRLVVQSFLDAQGAPTNGKDGTSVHRIRYDDAGNIVEEAYFDGHHSPVSPKGMPYASIRYGFDTRQRLVETSFFDATGAPNGADGVATVRYVRDGYGRPTETSYFDRSGAPTSKDGKTVVRATYDASGRLVVERFLDSSGALKSGADGCAGYRNKYDAHGRMTETVCLNAKEEPTLGAEGFAIRRTVHDGRGNEVDVSTWTADGLRSPDKEGIARRHNRYDERNLLVAATYFDTADKPTKDRRGVHETRFAYSETGKALAPAYFDELGNAVAMDGPAILIVKDLPPLPAPADR